MPVAIHDKTPEGRRKLKEGKKEQEQYLEGLHNEWIGNHASKDTHVDEREAQVPAHIRENAERAEMETREKLAREERRQVQKSQVWAQSDSGLVFPGKYA